MKITKEQEPYYITGLTEKEFTSEDGLTAKVLLVMTADGNHYWFPHSSRDTLIDNMTNNVVSEEEIKSAKMIRILNIGDQPKIN